MKRVLMCVVEWIDGDEVRLMTVGWDEAGEPQRALMRTDALKLLDLDEKFILAVRFMEVNIPVISTVGTEPTVLTAEVAP